MFTRSAPRRILSTSNRPFRQTSHRHFICQHNMYRIPLAIILPFPIEPVCHYMTTRTEMSTTTTSHATSDAYAVPPFTSATGSSINADEVAKFSASSSEWWDESGEFAMLHKMNPIRSAFIRRAVDTYHQRKDLQDSAAADRPSLAGLEVCDVGCGGGLLSESLCRMGGRVTAVDASRENILIASAHKVNDSSLDTLQYVHTSAESMLESGKRFDLVCSLEVVEHVDEPQRFVETLCSLLKPNGLLVMSTMNRTALSYFLTIAMAEYALGWIRRGTHDWNKYLSPAELSDLIIRSRDVSGNNIASDTATSSSTTSSLAGMTIRSINGMIYNPLTVKWSLDENNTNVNYILCAQKNA